MFVKKYQVSRTKAKVKRQKIQHGGTVTRRENVSSYKYQVSRTKLKVKSFGLRFVIQDS